MKLTKKVLKDTVVSLQGDPFFLTSVITDSFQVLPKNLQDYLAKLMYIKYAYKGIYYEVTDKINNVVELLFSAKEVCDYISERNPSTTLASVYSAINRGYNLHDHIILKKKNS